MLCEVLSCTIGDATDRDDDYDDDDYAILVFVIVTYDFDSGREG